MNAVVAFRQPREHDKKHLKFVAGLPCIICANNLGVDAAHIRYSDYRVDKRPVGIGEKPDDIWTVPLCRMHHMQQHSMNEREFWSVFGIDPVFYALAIYARSGDQERAERIVGAARTFIETAP